MSSCQAAVTPPKMPIHPGLPQPPEPLFATLFPNRKPRGPCQRLLGQAAASANAGGKIGLHPSAIPCSPHWAPACCLRAAGWSSHKALTPDAHEPTKMARFPSRELRD